MRWDTTEGAGLDRLNVLIHGPAGSGKTTLAGTTDNLDSTLLIAAEPGALPLRKLAIKRGTPETWRDFAGLPARLLAADKVPAWIIVDSLSELAETLLTELKTQHKDPRKAYGEMADAMTVALKAYRDLPAHVVFLAKQSRTQQDGGPLLFGPSVPGRQLAGRLPYEFDIVCALRVQTDDDGSVKRWLQTGADGIYDAKDRSGALSPAEPPNLAALAAKIKASE